MRILVCDDASFMRMTLKQILENAGHKVIAEAADGEEAFEKYKQFKPDMVTMDITMPEYNGIYALQKIKEFDPSATIIVVSAMGQQEMVVQAIQNGATSFIVKPFKPSKIIDTITMYDPTKGVEQDDDLW